MPTATSTDAKVIERAFAVWEVMHDEAKKRGMALIRHRSFGDGRVIVRTTSAFIRALNSERDWKLSKNDEDLIRRYLKASGNVVTLEKLEQYQFRIFIREEWSNQMMIAQTQKEPDSIAQRAQRLTPEEAGETREPAPVIYKCSYCTKEYNNPQQLGGHISSAHKERKPVEKKAKKAPVGGSRVPQRLEHAGPHGQRIMRLLGQHGGELVSPNGRMARLVHELDPEIGRENSDATRRLEEHGWIMRDGNTRKIYKIALTRKGWDILGAKPPTVPDQPATEAVLSNVPAGVDDHTLDGLVISAVEHRLAEYRAKAKDTTEADKLRDVIKLIESILDEVDNGDTKPLKALADIQEAVKL